MNAQPSVMLYRATGVVKCLYEWEVFLTGTHMWERLPPIGRFGSHL